MASPLPLGCYHHIQKRKRSLTTYKQRSSHTTYLFIGTVTGDDAATTSPHTDINKDADNSQEYMTSNDTTHKEEEIETGSEIFMMEQVETPKEAGSVHEHVENVDEHNITPDYTQWEDSDDHDYLDFEFVSKRCRDQRQTKPTGQNSRYQAVNVHKTERKRSSVIEARLARETREQKRQEEKHRKKRDDEDKEIQTTKQPREKNRQHAQYQQSDFGVVQFVLSSPIVDSQQHVQLIPTQHIVNRKNLASGVNERLLDLQDRDLTPEDYDLLLTLDDLVARPTVNSETIERLPTYTAVEDDGGDACSVCIDRYKIGEEITTLPCAHRFHTRCINQWLTTVSNRCPLDGNLIT